MTVITIVKMMKITGPTNTVAKNVTAINQNKKEIGMNRTIQRDNERASIVQFLVVFFLCVGWMLYVYCMLLH